MPFNPDDFDIFFQQPVATQPEDDGDGTFNFDKLPGWCKGLIQTGGVDGYESRSERDCAVVGCLLFHKASGSNIKDIFDKYPVGDKYRNERNGKAYLKYTIDSMKKKPKLINLDDKREKKQIDYHDEADRFVENNPTLYLPKIGFYLYENGVYKLKNDEDILKEIDEQLGKRGKKTQRGELLSAISLHSDVFRSTEFNLNTNRRRLNLLNGIYDIDTGVLSDHSPKTVSTIQLPVSFNPEASCPIWLKYLSEAQPNTESHAILQQFAGLSLIGDTRYEKSLWLTGSGGNGKGKFINTIAAMLGEENVAAEEIQTLHEEFHAISLRGKLLNISTEVATGDITETYGFQRIVTGDIMYDSYKGETRFGFRTHCLMIFSLNTLPRIVNNTDAFYDRVTLIKFPVNFRTDPRLDPDLGDKLLTELDGIFLWALEGLRRLESQRGFTTSDTINDNVFEYRMANDTVASFVNDKCKRHSYASRGRSRIYSSYREYCKENGYVAMANRRFFTELRRVCPEIETPENLVTLDGIRDRLLLGIDLADPIPFYQNEATD